MSENNKIGQIKIDIADSKYIPYIDTINQTIEDASMERGTGIAKRSFEYLKEKMENGKAIIATDNGSFAGFCYIETWGHGRFVANSGLIVLGLPKKLKRRLLNYRGQNSRKPKFSG
jgi:hypothetical protein